MAPPVTPTPPPVIKKNPSPENDAAAAKDREEHEAAIKEVASIRQKLLSEWNKGTGRNYNELDRLLDASKIMLTKMQYLPLKSGASGTSERELLIARDMLEIGAKISVAKMEKNGSESGMVEFDRYIAQLKHYYFDLKNSFKKPSDSMYEILGMNLLKLLSQNRILDFHLELELFVHPDATVILNNVYIKKAVEIEQYLTEGRYNKVLALHLANADDLQRAGLVSTGFRYFIEQVVDNSREVIAEVIESAYDRLRTSVAAKSLHSGNNPQVLKHFAQKRDWTIGNDGYVYFKKNKTSKDILPAKQLITDSLKYAEDLDTII